MLTSRRLYKSTTGYKREYLQKSVFLYMGVKNMYDVKGTVCELIDEENFVLTHMSEYYLRACYNQVPITHEMYDKIVIELTEHSCISLLDIFFDKHMLYFDNEMLGDRKVDFL